jgi:hypothetical protein
MSQSNGEPPGGPPTTIIQAAGQAGVSLARSLSNQPIVVGFLVINLVFMVLVFLNGREVRSGERTLMHLMIERCVEQSKAG